MEDNHNLYQGAEDYARAMQAKKESEEAKNELAIVSELGLEPIRDENQYCFLWGDVPTGIAGFGDSVSDAVRDFNKNYYEDFSNKKIEK